MICPASTAFHGIKVQPIQYFHPVAFVQNIVDPAGHAKNTNRFFCNQGFNVVAPQSSFQQKAAKTQALCNIKDQRQALKNTSVFFQQGDEADFHRVCLAIDRFSPFDETVHQAVGNVSEHRTHHLLQQSAGEFVIEFEADLAGIFP